MSVVPQPLMELRTSPHFRSAATVENIMLNVVFALMPISIFAIFQFGVSAFCLMVVCTLSCVLTEYFLNWAKRKDSPIGDYSAVITGLLLALTLPPGFPLWMGAVGGFVSIALGKALFGGIGFNVFNPALVGRAFLQAAFPVAITTWAPAGVKGRLAEFIPSSLAFPFMTADADTFSNWLQAAMLEVDGFTGATPLALHKFDGIQTDLSSLITGMTAGSAGETSALLILICGAYLAVRKMMDWRVPAAMLLGAFVTGGVFWLINREVYPDPIFILFSGGLMLGAVFMASDMVASPVTPLGVWIYGLLMGFLTVLIRLEGNLPEGVMYAILLGNALSPIIDRLTPPRIYGATKKPKAPQ